MNYYPSSVLPVNHVKIRRLVGLIRLSANFDIHDKPAVKQVIESTSPFLASVKAEGLGIHQVRLAPFTQTIAGYTWEFKRLRNGVKCIVPRTVMERIEKVKHHFQSPYDSLPPFVAILKADAHGPKPKSAPSGLVSIVEEGIEPLRALSSGVQPKAVVPYASSNRTHFALPAPKQGEFAIWCILGTWPVDE